MCLSLREEPDLALLMNYKGGARRGASLLGLTTEVFSESPLGSRSFEGKGGSPEMFGGR